MKIVINALSVYSGGGLVSLLELLPALREVDKDNEYVLLMASAQRSIIGEIPDGIRPYVINLNYRNVLLRTLFEQLALPCVLLWMGADWLYSLGNQAVLLAPCNVCVLMENPTPYSRLPVAWSSRDRIRHYLLRVLARLSCWRATKVRFLTENSCRIMSTRLRIPKRKTCVIPHGVRVQQLSSGEDAGEDIIQLPTHYVFTASNFYPHKNFQSLMKGFDGFVQRYGYKGSLVIAGAFLFKEYLASLNELRTNLQSGDRIIFLGWVNPKDLGPLYARADLFVFPSLAETFGIPIIEAMAYGVPVIASKVMNDLDEHFIPFEEICGSAAVYFNPFDPEDLAAKMHQVCSDPGLRESIVASGKVRAREFSWLTTAKLLSREFSSKLRG